MRRIEIVKDRCSQMKWKLCTRRVTPFGTSAKISVPKKHIGQRAYVVILKD